MAYSNCDNKTVAVTGSAGFVGIPLVMKLQEMGCTVVELDVTNGTDMTDWNQVRNTPKMDCLIHLAGKTFVPDSYSNAGDFMRTNTGSLINSLELCRLYNAKIIFASSYVYGVPRYLPIDEKHPLSAFNPYASSKVIGEQLCKDYHAHFGLRVIILRPFNIYGLGQDERFLIPTIVKQASTGIISLKDPAPKRDFVYIDDAVNAYSKAVLYEKSKYEVFNIASGTSSSIQEICQIVTKLYDKQIEVQFSGEKRPNEVSDILGNYNKAKKLLNWNPTTSMMNGLKMMVENKLYNSCQKGLQSRYTKNNLTSRNVHQKK